MTFVRDSKRGKSIIVLVMFLIMMVLGRLIWTYVFFIPEKEIKDGVISFKTSEELLSKTYFLNGDWDYYPEKILSQDELGEYEPAEMVKFNRFFTTKRRSVVKDGTYHLSMQVPPEKVMLAFHFLYFDNEDTFIINHDDLTDRERYPNIKKLDHVGTLPYTFIYEKEEGVTQLDITILVNSNRFYTAGRLTRGINFGEVSNVLRSVTITNSSEVLSFSSILLIGLFSLGLFLTVKRNKKYMSISGILITLSLILMIGSDGKVLQQLLYLDNDTRYRFLIIVTYLFCLLMLSLVQIEKASLWSKSMVAYKGILLGLMVFAFVCPVSWLFQLGIVHKAIVMVTLSITIIGIKKILTDDVSFKQSFILSLLFMGHHFIWAMYYSTSGLTVPFYPIDLVAAILCITYAWFKHYHQLFITMDHLNVSLLEASQSKKELLTKTALRLNKPVRDMLNISDKLLKDIGNEDYQRVTDELIALNRVNRESVQLMDNLIKLTTESYSPNDKNKEVISLHRKISYCVKMIDKEQSFSNMTLQLNLSHENDLVYGNTQLFVQMMYQIFSFGYHTNTTGTVKISDRNDGDKATLLIEYKGLILPDSFWTDVHAPLDERIINSELFESSYGVEMLLIQSLVTNQSGESDITQCLDSVLLTISLNKSPQQELSSAEYQMQQEYKLLLPKLEKDMAFKNKILIVCCDVKELLSMKMLLEREDTVIFMAETRREAMMYMSSYRLDLIICDVMLDETNGYELTRDIRKLYSPVELPILLMAINKRKVEVDEIYSCGANDYIEKPIDFTEYVARVDALLEMKKNVESAIHYESSWLQAQIEPHFLFNTLNTIISLSTYDEETMQDVLEAFMLVLHNKYKYSGQNALIPLDKELELVKAYLLIEQARYGDKIGVVWRLAPNIDLSKVSILPLTIQPLIENAVKHGILQKQGQGEIIIAITDHPSEVSVTISDNGIGTDISLWDLLNKANEHQSGIGLSNTYYRLKKVMNVDMTFESTENVGTCISFRLSKD